MSVTDDPALNWVKLGGVCGIGVSEKRLPCHDGGVHETKSPHLLHGKESNGKLERYHRTIKSECIRPGAPLSVEDARRIVGGYVTHYNEVRLHAAIGYVAPSVTDDPAVVIRGQWRGWVCNR